MRVHAGDKKTIEYFQKREYENALNQLYSVKVEKLYKTQKGLCPCCEENITDRQIADKETQLHHMQPCSECGTDKLNNLRLLHKECHIKIHSLLSRKQMAYWWQHKPKLNYISKRCIADIIKQPEAYAVV